jgi:HK97 family phage major capsid protein
MNMKALIEKAKDVAGAAADEGRSLTEEERGLVQQAIDGAKALKLDAELASAVNQLGADLAAPAPVAKAAAPAPRTIGGRLMTDDRFKSWIDQANAAGLPDPRSLSNSPAVTIGGLKATLLGGSESSAGALVVNDFAGLQDESYAKELNLLSLITVGSTGSDAVEFARVLRLDEGSTNAASPLAEGAAANEGTLAFDVAVAPVREVRTFIPASNRALADAGQLQTVVDGFLRYGILETVTNQIINGNGIGQNMTGILNTSGVFQQGFDTDEITSLRKAITKVRHTGNYVPNAVLLNPEDAETIDLLTGSVGDEYLFGGPAVPSTVRTMWGLPMVTDAQVPQGTALVGDFRRAVLWERQAVTVSVYPQHSDFAVRGLVAIVGAARAAFGVVAPGAFCAVDLTAGS